MQEIHVEVGTATVCSRIARGSLLEVLLFKWEHNQCTFLIIF